MEIKESEIKNIWILTLNGVMDAHTSPNIKAKLEAGIASGKTKIIVEMKDVTYLSSAGGYAVVATMTNTWTLFTLMRQESE